MGNWLQDHFFMVTVGEYTLPDIENLLFMTRCEKGKCACPLGLYVFKCMEFWGYLIAEEEYTPGSSATEKVMDYLALTLGNEEAATLRPAIEFCSIPYALLAAGRCGITVMEPHPLFEHLVLDTGKVAVLNTRKLAQVYKRSLDELHRLLGNKAVAKRVERRLKVLKEGQNELYVKT
jgi:hypothetical protein